MALALPAASRGLATPPSDRVLQEEAGPSGVHSPEQSLERGGAREIVEAGYARGNAKLSKEHNPLNKWKRDRSGQFHNQMWFLKQEGMDHFEEWGEDHDKPWPYRHPTRRTARSRRTRCRRSGRRSPARWSTARG